MKNLFKSVLVLGCVFTSAVMVSQAKAVTIAIVDSGTDVLHPDLAGKIWDNPGEIDNGVDNDDDGFIGDVHGWNFVDGNNHLVNRKLIGTFSADIYQYFEVQTRVLKGTATDADRDWIAAHKGDADYLARLEDFGNFVHGTHVAGIASKDAADARLMILKIIGNPTPIGAGSVEPTRSAGLEAFQAYLQANLSDNIIDQAKEKIIMAGLDVLGGAQGQGLAAPAAYLDMKHAKVANCSFGTSREAVKPLLKGIIEPILGHELSEDELNKYANYFIQKTLDSIQKSFITASPQTLFVIAAGNDGTNNDEIPTAPANIKLENTITVAATLEQSKLASFSNYGEDMVDVAAPGVGILSSIPGLPGMDHVQLSGTSQATPYVTNVLGQIFDANPKLSMGEAKLVLMETVDKKDFLLHKVKSAGLVNPERAILAAKKSVSTSVSEAISQANREITQPMELMEANLVDESQLIVSPLPYTMY